MTPLPAAAVARVLELDPTPGLFGRDPSGPLAVVLVYDDEQAPGGRAAILLATKEELSSEVAKCIAARTRYLLCSVPRSALR